MRLFLLATALVSLACTGAIGEGVDTSGGNPGVGGSGPGAACTPGGVPPAPLRRLSHAEYVATLNDLFPGLQIGRPTLVRDPGEDGFENRAKLLNPSPLLVEQYSAIAVDVAIKAIAKPSAILPCTPTPATEVACGAQFVDTFGARVFRRPLTVDEKKSYTDHFNAERAAGSGFNGAVQLTIENMLQSPQFLYRLEFGQPKLSPYEIASRMSYLVWGGPPDAPLLDRARTSQLDLPAEREKEARRMLADPRARGMLVEFHRQWLDLDRIDREAKDPKTYPLYNDALKAAMREESDRLVAAVMKVDGTLRSLFTSARTEVNAALAKFYGAPAPVSGWAETALNPMERSGFLTRPNFLASQAHLIEGSPPLRAIFILERLLCQHLPPPPADADLSEPAAQGGTARKTNRQLFEERIQPAACAGCHALFQPLGNAFENYDAIGRYRTMDNGLPVDARAQFRLDTTDWQFNGAIELSQKLGDSSLVQSCVARHWFEYAQGRPEEAADGCRIKEIETAFAAARGDVRELLVAIVKGPEFIYSSTRPTEQGR